MSGRLEGKTIMVTGGSSGLGRAMSIAFAREGADVVVGDVRAEPREGGPPTAELIAAEGGRGVFVTADVSRWDDIDLLVRTAVERGGRLDVMVNNAGMETRTSLLDTTERQFDLVVGVDLKSAFFGTQAAAKQMIAQKSGGHIINISSVHEEWPMPGNIAYCCSKGGMRMLARTAGVELASHGIRVINVGPGAVATPIDAATLANPQQKARLDAAIPLGRVAQPCEIANLVVWLASDQASYGTATTYFVDGGLMQASVGL